MTVFAPTLWAGAEAAAGGSLVEMAQFPSQPGASPLCWWPVHDDVDPQDLHGVEGAGQVAHSGQSDEAQG